MATDPCRVLERVYREPIQRPDIILHEFEREEGLTWSRQGEHREGRYLIICKPVCHVGSLPWHKIDTNMVGDEAVQYVFCC
jgi:hypothetical protein